MAVRFRETPFGVHISLLTPFILPWSQTIPLPQSTFLFCHPRPCFLRVTHFSPPPIPKQVDLCISISISPPTTKFPVHLAVSCQRCPHQPKGIYSLSMTDSALVAIPFKPYSIFHSYQHFACWTLFKFLESEYKGGPPYSCRIPSVHSIKFQAATFLLDSTVLWVTKGKKNP